MLIKATAKFSIENVGGVAFDMEAGEYAELRQDVAQRACLQGAAVPATLEQVRSEEASRLQSMKVTEVVAEAEAPKAYSRKSKYNDADPAKE